MNVVKAMVTKLSERKPGTGSKEFLEADAAKALLVSANVRRGIKLETTFVLTNIEAQASAPHIAVGSPENIMPSGGADWF